MIKTKVVLIIFIIQYTIYFIFEYLIFQIYHRFCSKDTTTIQRKIRKKNSKIIKRPVSSQGVFDHSDGGGPTF